MTTRGGRDPDRNTQLEMISLSDVIVQLIDTIDGSTLDELITGVHEEWGDCDPRLIGIALCTMRRAGVIRRVGPRRRGRGRYYRRDGAR